MIIEHWIEPIKIVLVSRLRHYSTFNMASSKVAEIPKLFAVTLIRSGIRQPYWEKRTLKALGLTKLQKTVVHKNTPSVNGQLNSVKHLVSITPINIKHVKNMNSPSAEFHGSVSTEGEGGTALFLKKNGEFNIEKYLEYCRPHEKERV